MASRPYKVVKCVFGMPHVREDGSATVALNQRFHTKASTDAQPLHYASSSSVFNSNDSSKFQFSNVVDWSKGGRIISAVDSNVSVISIDGTTISDPRALPVDSSLGTISMARWCLGDVVTLGYKSGDINLFDTVKGSMVRALPKFQGAVLSGSMSVGGASIFVAGAADGAVSFLDVRSKEALVLSIPPNPSGPIAAVEWNPQRPNVIATGCGTDGDHVKAHIWDVRAARGKLLDTPWLSLPCSYVGVKALAWHPEKANILATGDAHGISIWSASKGDTNAGLASSTSSPGVACLRWLGGNDLLSSHDQSSKALELSQWCAKEDSAPPNPVWSLRRSRYVEGRNRKIVSVCTNASFSTGQVDVLTLASDGSLSLARFDRNIIDAGYVGMPPATPAPSSSGSVASSTVARARKENLPIPGAGTMLHPNRQNPLGEVNMNTINKGELK